MEMLVRRRPANTNEKGWLGKQLGIREARAFYNRKEEDPGVVVVKSCNLRMFWQEGIT